MKAVIASATLLGALLAAMPATAGITGTARQELHSNAATSGASLLALGPVDRAVNGATRVSILGQVVRTSSPMRIPAGEYVAVFGEFLATGEIAAAKVTRLGSYVAGESQVYVVGTVTALRPKVGLVRVGNLWVSYTDLLASAPSLSFTVGQAVSWGGTRADSTGVARATFVSGPAVQGATGTSLQGISATSLQGITGTASQGITGTASQGITGTASQGITGTASQGITGTASQGITGTASQGITGTASQGITGTASQGITGTASQGITGTASQGITGTASQGITGTASQEIAGTAAD